MKKKSDGFEIQGWPWSSLLLEYFRKVERGSETLGSGTIPHSFHQKELLCQLGVKKIYKVKIVKSVLTMTVMELDWLENIKVLLWGAGVFWFWATFHVELIESFKCWDHNSATWRWNALHNGHNRSKYQPLKGFDLFGVLLGVAPNWASAFFASWFQHGRAAAQAQRWVFFKVSLAFYLISLVIGFCIERADGVHPRQDCLAHDSLENDHKQVQLFSAHPPQHWPSFRCTLQYVAHTASAGRPSRLLQLQLLFAT